MTRYLKFFIAASAFMCTSLGVISTAQAGDEKSGFGLGMKLMQDLWRGVTEPQRVTTC